MHRPWSAFANRQYRWLAASFTADMFALGALSLTIVWLVIGQLGRGERALSVVLTAMSVGLLASVFAGGVIADRVEQRRILLTTAIVRIATSAAVATAALSEHLAVTGLACGALVLGLAEGLAFPAYGSLMPRIVEPELLLSANSFEGLIAPLGSLAVGPLIAGLVVSRFSAPTAMVLVCLGFVASLLALAALDDPAVPRRESAESGWHDFVVGWRWMLTTPWFGVILAFAAVWVLASLGPLQVLVPFIITERAGGGPREHAIVMGIYGLGGALGAVLAGWRPLPRRYLTWFTLVWGAAGLPMMVLGLVSNLVLIAMVMFTTRFMSGWAMVVWGTMLQQRVPAHMLGRAASMDYLVSLVFLPFSMALAAPVSQHIGLTATFVLGGLVGVIGAPVAIVAARMRSDEIAHPLR